MRKYDITMEGDNKIGVVAPTEKEARAQASNMVKGLKVESVVDTGPAEAPKPRPLTPAVMKEAMARRSRSAPKTSPIRGRKKIGRNQQCPCGSGKKFKKCCGRQRRR